MTGLGMGMSTTPGVILVARYFESNRAKANALYLSGTAAGSFIIPFLIEALLKVYGLKGTALIIGGCMSHVAVAAALYRPLRVHNKIMASRALKKPPPPVDAENHIHTLTLPDGTVATQPVANLVGPHEHNEHFVEEEDDDNSSQWSGSTLGDERRRKHHADLRRQLSNQHHRHHHHHHYRHSQQRRKYGNALSAASITSTPGGHFRRHVDLLSAAESGINSLHHRSHSSEPHVDTVGTHHPNGHHHRHAKSMSLRSVFLGQLESTFGRGEHHQLRVKRQFSEQPRLRRRRTESENSAVFSEAAHVSSVPNSGFNFRCSLLFSVDDLCTDSTSILKDPRAVAVAAGSNEALGNELARVASRCSSRHLDSSSTTLAGGHRPGFLRQRSAAPQAQSTSSNASRVRRPRCYSEGQKDDQGGSSEEVKGRFKLILPDGANEEEEEDEQEEEPEEERKHCCQSFGSWLYDFFDLSLASDPVFLLMAASVMFMACGMPHFLFFLPSYAKTKDDGADPAVLLAVASALDLLGRFGGGFILDNRLLPSHLLYSVSIIVSGLSVLAVPALRAVERPAVLATLCGLYGLGTGLWFLMMPLLLSEYLGVQRIGSSYGLVRFFQAGANLLGSSVGGFLWEATGALDASLAVMGAAMTLGAAFPLAIPKAVRRKEEKDGTTRDHGK